MSLKAFHIFFIVVSTTLLLGFGSWAMRDYVASQGSGSLYLTIGAFAGALLLGVYAVWFLRKMRGMNVT